MPTNYSPYTGTSSTSGGYTPTNYSPAPNASIGVNTAASYNHNNKETGAYSISTGGSAGPQITGHLGGYSGGGGGGSSGGGSSSSSSANSTPTPQKLQTPKRQQAPLNPNANQISSNSNRRANLQKYQAQYALQGNLPNSRLNRYNNSSTYIQPTAWNNKAVNNPLGTHPLSGNPSPGNQSGERQVNNIDYSNPNIPLPTNSIVYDLNNPGLSISLERLYNAQHGPNGKKLTKKQQNQNAKDYILKQQGYSPLPNYQGGQGGYTKIKNTNSSIKTSQNNSVPNNFGITGGGTIMPAKENYKRAGTAANLLEASSMYAGDLLGLRGNQRFANAFGNVAIGIVAGGANTFIGQEAGTITAIGNKAIPTIADKIGTTISIGGIIGSLGYTGYEYNKEAQRRGGGAYNYGNVAVDYGQRTLTTLGTAGGVSSLTSGTISPSNPTIEGQYAQREGIYQQQNNVFPGRGQAFKGTISQEIPGQGKVTLPVKSATVKNLAGGETYYTTTIGKNTVQGRVIDAISKNTRTLSRISGQTPQGFTVEIPSTLTTSLRNQMTGIPGRITNYYETNNVIRLPSNNPLVQRFYAQTSYQTLSSKRNIAPLSRLLLQGGMRSIKPTGKTQGDIILSNSIIAPQELTRPVVTEQPSLLSSKNTPGSSLESDLGSSIIDNLQNQQSPSRIGILSITGISGRTNTRTNTNPLSKIKSLTIQRPEQRQPTKQRQPTMTNQIQLLLTSPVYKQPPEPLPLAFYNNPPVRGGGPITPPFMLPPRFGSSRSTGGRRGRGRSRASPSYKPSILAELGDIRGGLTSSQKKGNFNNPFSVRPLPAFSSKSSGKGNSKKGKRNSKSKKGKRNPLGIKPILNL